MSRRLPRRSPTASRRSPTPDSLAFPAEPGVDRSRVQLSQSAEAVYSITRPGPAARIQELLAMYLRMHGKTPNTSTVTDATACVGGDTIHFAKAFRTVNAIECNATHHAMLLHNLGVYGRQNVRVHLGDALRVLPTLQQDLVFMDPPWGGRDYARKSRISLALSGVPLATVVRRMLHHTPLVALKLPRNADLRGMLEHAMHTPGMEMHVHRVAQFVLVVLVAGATATRSTRQARAGWNRRGARRSA